MEIQLWRNATVLLKINGLKLLIDPMLGAKGSFGVFPWTNDTRLNPLTDLPFSANKLNSLLSELDAVVVSHLHPDHWDAAAVKLLDKKLPVICPKPIAQIISDYGGRLRTKSAVASPSALTVTVTVFAGNRSCQASIV